jgi:tape measure domain-containing protein
MRDLEVRLRLATGSSEAAGVAFERITQTATAAGANLQSVAELYARIARVTATLGVSQMEVAEVTDTLTKALAAFGETGPGAEAALVQLGQAFASGTLRGDELRSVMEQIPSVGKLIADGLGVPIGKLRELGEQGQLTSEQVFRALQSQRQAVENAFAQMPNTIGKAAQRVANAWSLFVAELDKTSGASERVAGLLDSVAENLDTVARLAAEAGVVIAAGLVGKAIPAILEFGKSLAGAVAGAGSLAGALKKLPLSVKFTVAAVGMELAIEGAVLLARKLAELQEHDKAYQAQQAATKARFEAEGMAAREAANAVEEYAKVRVLKMEEVARLSEKEKAAYLDALNTARVYWAETLRAEVLLGKVHGDNVAAQEKAKAALEATGRSLAEFAAATNLSAEAVRSLLAIDARNLIDQFSQLKAKGKDTQEALEEIGKTFDPASVQSVRAFGQAIAELMLTGKIGAEDFRAAWGSALKGLDPTQLLAFQKSAKEAFGSSLRDVTTLQEALDVNLRNALQGAGLDVDKAFTGMSKKAGDAIAAVENLIDNTELLKQQSKNAGEVMREAFANAIDQADTPKALEKLGRLVEQVGQKAVMSTDQMSKLRESLGQRIAEVTPGIQTLEEAFEKLGIQSQAALKATANSAKEAFDALQALGAPLEDQKAGFLAYAEAAIKANGGVADAGLRAEAATLGLGNELAKLVQATERARAGLEALRAMQDRGARTAERNTEAVRQQGTAMVAAAQQALENAKAQGDLLAVEEATVNVRQAEAKAARDLAEALEAEAAAAWNNVAAMKEKAAADGEVSQAEQEIIDSATQAAEALTAQATAAQNAADKADAASKAATEKKEEVRTATIDWEGLAASYGLAADKGSELARAQAAIWAGMKKVYSTGFGNLDNYIDAMNRAAAQAAQYIKALDGVEEAARGGDESLSEYIRALRRAIAAGQLLGDEELRPLRDALQDAKERMQGLSDSARDTLNSLRDELDSMNQNYDAIERRRFEARKSEIEAQIAIAKAAGNSQAVADLTKALTLLRQVSAERIKEAEAREREDARKLKGTAGSASLLPTGEGSGAGATPVKIVDINIKVGDQTGTVKAVEGSEEVLVDMLRQAQMVAS